MKIKALKFSNHPVLKNLDFNFEVNGVIQDITLLVGENGCGKTILLDEIYKIFNGGITPWNDEIGRELTVEFSDDEKNILESPSNVVTFKYPGVKTANWQNFRIYDNANQNISTALLQKLQDGNVNELLICAYSTVEINFTTKNIDSVKATSIDTEEKPKTKSTESIATEIAQLLVDINAQDDAVKAEWLDNNEGKPAPKIEGKLDRFRRAYHNMFENKQLCSIQPEDGQQKILFKDLDDDSKFEISKLSSGEKQVVYRVGYLLKNLKTISGGIILIDEPELSLHPRWQVKYIDFLRELFLNNDQMAVQFVIATHSPYLLQNSQLNDVGVAVFKKEKGNQIIERPDNNLWTLFKFGPTVGEISYHAFHLPSIDFHNELYGHIQEKEMKFTEKDIEIYLVSKNIKKTKKWIKLDKNGSTQPTYDITLMTYIRNSIHHPENQHNDEFTEKELKESIESMVPLSR